MRPDDRSGLLGVGGVVVGIGGMHMAIRRDDRAGRLEPGPSSTPDRPDDRAGIRGPGTTPAETGVVVSAPGDPFEWGDAFVGAGATFGLFVLAGALTLTLRSRGRLMTH